LRPRSLAILALLVAALGAFVWFWERKQPGTAEREADARKVLGGIEQKDVREVVIEQGASRVRLVRETPAGGEGTAGEEADSGDGEDDEESEDAPPGDALDLFESTAEWRLAEPLAARAERTAVDGLLSSLLGLEKGRTVEGIEMKEYGLDPAEARVTLVTADGERTLLIGRQIPGGDQRVVALAEGDEVWTVPGAFWAEVAKPAGDWRSRQLFPGQRHEIERVALRRGADAIVLAKRGDDFWLEAPVADRADRERVEELLTAVTGLEAIEFLDAGATAQDGLETPEAVVEVALQGRPEPFRLALAALRGEGEAAVRVARAGEQVVTVTSTGFDAAVARPAHEWRSRALGSLPVYDVDRVEVTDAQGALTLVRADADWQRDGVRIFYGPVSDLLSAATDARATEVLPAAEAAALVAGPPAVALRLVGRESREETLEIWPAGQRGAPARVSGRDVVLLLPADTLATVTGYLKAVREAEAVPEPTPEPPGDAAAAGADEDEAPPQP
jgi:hypothetical protein